MHTTDKEYILLYRKLVEEKWMLGSEGKLKLRDYEFLARLIEEKSKITLSVSTLKRIWREDFAQEPHPTTLDALVSVLDFTTWQDFRKAFAAKFEVAEQSRSRKKVPTSLFVIGGFVLLMTGFLALQAFNKEDSRLPVKIPFTAEKAVAVGVPNTVLFNYDFRNVEANSFFIQPSGDSSYKSPVDPNNHSFAATYYEPGFHWAQLMADDSIVTFASVHVQTDGWLPLIKFEVENKAPLYLHANEAHQSGMLTTSESSLSAAGLGAKEKFYVHYYNVRDFENVDSNNFRIETKMKCDLPVLFPSSPCPQMILTVVTEEDSFQIPLALTGCTEELELRVGEKNVNGKERDLSSFGTNVYDWQTLHLSVREKKADIQLNGKTIHQLEFERNFGKIKGLAYTFSGLGSVDHVRLINKQDAVVYEDQFETTLP